jgi:hypothetical protein
MCTFSLSSLFVTRDFYIGPVSQVFLHRAHVRVHVCVKERLPDMLSVCLQLFLYASNDIASKMWTILYGRQLAVSWCTSRVNFDAGLNHSPACRPPAFSHWPE